ncbi:TonB-dependent receptor domain-containing protein [Methylocucumis oryzae]|uniref:TonB-dependent receptor domain-containing protein n=1 Tax=Methylocucumis oryzae TaxID=1632867 RepID=UPI000695A5E3|nr:TonB-dependent receptor [Methylocucumis oryzae]
MVTQRWGTSLTHELNFTDNITLTTNAYWTHFNRDWWRQASTTTDSQCGSAFTAARLAGTVVDPDSCASFQGRLREYYTYGVEPRLHINHQTFGLENETDIGFRAHFEEQQRVQENSTSPLVRSGTVSENNDRETDAYSGYLQNRVILGSFSLTPGLRVEHVDFRRQNNLTDASGETTLTSVLPAFGATYSPGDKITAFFRLPWWICPAKGGRFD